MEKPHSGVAAEDKRVSETVAQISDRSCVMLARTCFDGVVPMSATAGAD